MLPELTESEIVARLRTAYQPSTLESDTRLKCAAVLMPLVRDHEGWHLLFTRRTDRVETHKGQVSFPGGACDPGDEGPEATALRESEEELGIRPGDVRLLGRLNAMQTITHFRVFPVVGVVPWPYAFRVSTIEVARLFRMPLAWLARPENRREFAIPATGIRVQAFQPYDSELLWGATAQMTVDLMRVIGLLNGSG